GLRGDIHDRDRELARRRVGHRPLATAGYSGQQVRARDVGVLEPGAYGPGLTQRLDRVQDDGRLLDRVDSTPGAPVRLADLRVSGAARDMDDAVLGAAAGYPDREAGGLGDDRGV